MSAQLKLLKVKRFAPLFVTQFLGAFNDNMFKNAFVIIATYREDFTSFFNLDPNVTVPLSTAVFILPYFLFSSLAGQIADKYEKSRLIRILKIVELCLMLLAGLAFYSKNLDFLLAILFLLGMQATFFAPLKYSILTEHLHKDELVAGNGLVEAGAFLAILLGTVTGGYLVHQAEGLLEITGVVVLMSVIGYSASRYIPLSLIGDPNLKISKNFVLETVRMIRQVSKNNNVYQAILGISWFWFIGASFFSIIPIYSKEVLRGDELVTTFLFVTFAVGIAIGSMLCNWLLKGEIKADIVPWGGLGVSFFTGLTVFATGYHVLPPHSGLMTLSEFLSYSGNWLAPFCLMMVVVCGGIYAVPLYTIMLALSRRSHRARTVAANSVLNALFMVVSSLIISWMLSEMKISTLNIMKMLSVINILVVLMAFRKTNLPEGNLGVDN
jgi:acyl-[acyl-carrier-protein]-phospholipid O-acyltransferase / long-chain-fatty-acid--[acyl-carrier-protein] ligase